MKAAPAAIPARPNNYQNLLDKKGPDYLGAFAFGFSFLCESLSTLRLRVFFLVPLGPLLTWKSRFHFLASTNLGLWL